MRRFRSLSVLTRWGVLWAGTVFLGCVTRAQAQERYSIDTVNLFNAHTATVGMEFDAVLPLSAT